MEKIDVIRKIDSAYEIKDRRINMDKNEDLARRKNEVEKLILKKAELKMDLSLEIAILSDERDRYQEMIENL